MSIDATSAIKLLKPKSQFLLPIGGLGVLVLSPFIINDFIQARYMQAVLSLWLTFGVLYLGYKNLKGRVVSEVVFFLLFAPSTSLLLRICVQEQQWVGVLWSFPALIGMCFLFSLKYAALSCTLLTALVFPEVSRFADPELSLRILITFFCASGFSIAFTWLLDRQNRQLVGYASVDALTGLNNRFLVKHVLANYVKSAKKTGREFSLLQFELRDLRSINQAHGRVMGDLLLKEIASFLKTNLRMHDHLFRVDGQAFLICMPRTSYEEAQCIANEVSKALLEQTRRDGLMIDFDFGVVSSKGKESPEVLLDSAQELVRSI